MRIVAILALVLAACVPTAPVASPQATRSPDIQRSRIDIVFSGLIAGYYKPSSVELLTVALEAIRKEARDSSGNADVPTPRFDGSEEKQLADFRLFAAAAEQLATKNPQLSPSRISSVAIRAMFRVNPDCHNYFVPGRSGSLKPGFAEPLTAAGGLQTRMLPGNVGYLGWRSFMDPGVFDDIRAALDVLLAQGAKSWLFDVRDNGGGEGPQLMVSWWVEGGTIWREVDRDGKLTPAEAKREFYLPSKYQLPIAIAVNGRTGSSSEFFTLALQQRGRARVFGTRTVGCLGSVALVPLADGSLVGIAQSAVIGPVSDAPVNNVGIQPDVVVNGDAVDAAAAYLRSVSN